MAHMPSDAPAVALAMVHAPLWLFAGVKVSAPLAAPATAVPPVILTGSAVPVPPEMIVV